jgi:putative transposase
MADPRYTSHAGGVYSLKYHLVWCPKYRLPVLVDRIADDLRDLLHEKADALQVTIEALEIMPDHVHLFISADPTEAPQRLANQFKGFTSRRLRERHAVLRSRLPSLWSRSYYVGSIGHVSDKTVRQYIEAQRKRL